MKWKRDTSGNHAFWCVLRRVGRHRFDLHLRWNKEGCPVELVRTDMEDEDDTVTVSKATLKLAQPSVAELVGEPDPHSYMEPAVNWGRRILDSRRNVMQRLDRALSDWSGFESRIWALEHTYGAHFMAYMLDEWTEKHDCYNGNRNSLECQRASQMLGSMNTVISYQED